MSAAVTSAPAERTSNRQPGFMKDGRRRSWTSIIVATVLAALWVLPSLALFLSTLRSRDAQASVGWWNVFTDPLNQGWTLDNYTGVLQGQDMGASLLNTLVVSVPATILPIMFAAFGAYAFAFMNFPAKETLFVIIVGVMVVPIQVALSPMLNLLGPNGVGISGQFVAVWLLHTGFGMPLCLYTLRNYMSTLPFSVVESAKIDGASHYQTFWLLVAPMSIPAIAAFATLQFLWVWNDLLIAKLFLLPSNTTVVVRVQQMLGTQGQGAEIVTAGAFISMIVPILVFVLLQRFFVRGLTSGSVKG
ncbi:carbohydrate ABC transporter permease [Serinibacter arcticus]|uniref:Alpha-glucoside transport system permease protein AglG n=1 Tax=Serinibacter arcticus TaxID=1655435 RepID=A0A4Z1DZJ3_9MICO|nr:carbohydrate ABC transporter permease [Serinibacter arcticus]TGO05004.1 Alpha-glucoside transport system permease protein AglG [Serinibacter arcticus]